jgi:hypothetical protein
MSESRTTLSVVPTRDEDWHRLIERDQDDPLRRGSDAWLVFESLVEMGSAKAARDAIALADDACSRDSPLEPGRPWRPTSLPPRRF